MGRLRGIESLIDADFSSQYQHNLTRHDLRGGVPGGCIALGCARVAALALHHLRQSGASAACALQPSASRRGVGD